MKGTASIEDVCRLFLNDANRPLVRFIRYHALMAWRERTDMADWLQADPRGPSTSAKSLLGSSSTTHGSSIPNSFAGQCAMRDRRAHELVSGSKGLHTEPS